MTDDGKTEEMKEYNFYQICPPVKKGEGQQPLSKKPISRKFSPNTTIGEVKKEIFRPDNGSQNSGSEKEWFREGSLLYRPKGARRMEQLADDTAKLGTETTLYVMERQIPYAAEEPFHIPKLEIQPPKTLGDKYGPRQSDPRTPSPPPAQNEVSPSQREEELEVQVSALYSLYPDWAPDDLRGLLKTMTFEKAKEFLAPHEGASTSNSEQTGTAESYTSSTSGTGTAESYTSSTSGTGTAGSGSSTAGESGEVPEKKKNRRSIPVPEHLLKAYQRKAKKLKRLWRDLERADEEDRNLLLQEKNVWLREIVARFLIRPKKGENRVDSSDVKLFEDICREWPNSLPK